MTTQHKLYIAVVDLEVKQGQSLCKYINDKGHKADYYPTIASLINQLMSEEVDALILALTDESIEASQEALERLQERFSTLSIILAVPHQQIERAIAAMSQGVKGYILRPFYPAEVDAKLQQLQETKQLRSAESTTIETLLAVQAEMVRTPDEPSVKQKIVDVLVGTFGYHAAVYWMVDFEQHSGHLFIYATAGLSEYYLRNSAYSIPFGRGIVGEVFRTRKVKKIRDLLTYEGENYFPDLIAQAGLRGVIAVPLLLKNDVQGVLTCYTNQPHHFSENEEERLTALANLTSIDHKNARQFAKWLQLERISQKFAHVRELEEAINVVSNNVLNIAEAAGASICFYEAAKRQFVARLSRHVGTLGHQLIDWANICSHWQLIIDTILYGKALLIPNMQDERASTHLGSTIQAQLVEAGVHALIIEPLAGEEDPVGILLVYYAYEHPYANADKQTEYNTPLNIYSEQAAVTIGRAKFFRRRAEEQKFIRRFTRKTSSIPSWQDVEHEVWQTTLHEVKELTGAERAMIALQDEETLTLIQYAVPKAISSDYMVNLLSLAEESIEGWVQKHIKPIIVRNMNREQRWQDIGALQHHKTQSKLVIPIIKGQTKSLLGLISLESDHQNIFDSYDRELVENLAAHIGIDAKFDQLYGSRERQTKQLRSLVKAGQRFAAVQPIRDTLQKTLDELREELDYDIVRLHMYDPYWNRFDIPITSGRLTLNSFVVLASKKATDWPIGLGNRYFTSDHEQRYAAFEDFANSDHADEFGLIRLQNESEVIGLLVVKTYQPHQFSSQERVILDHFTQLIQEIILKSYFLPSLVKSLQDALGPDLVRLHLYDSQKEKWSRPVTDGRLNIPHEWKAKETFKGPISRALTLKHDHHFVSDATVDPILNGNFVRREKIKSAGYVMLTMNNELMGILFVNWRKVHHWTQAELYAVQLFANQAAVTIHNRRQVMSIKNKQHTFSAFQAATKEISQAKLDKEKVFQAILAQAIAATGAYCALIRMKEGERLKAISILGLTLDAEKRWQEHYAVLALNGKGITVRAIRENHFQSVPNVALDEEYLDTSEGKSKSELVVVLRDARDSNKPIGVISAQHQELSGFDKTDIQALLILCDMASVVLKLIEQYEDLVRLKQNLETTEAIALRGLFGANWWHTAHQKSLAIKTRVLLLQESISNLDDKMIKWLQDIQDAAEEIDNIPTKGLLPRTLESAPTPIAIKSLLRESITPLCKNLPDIELLFDLKCQGARIAVHKALFDLAMEKLVKNAIEAMQEEGQLTIWSRLKQHAVEIRLIDTGPGIPAEVNPYFLKQRIPKALAGEGFGLGGLLARFVFNRYGGQLKVLWSNREEGTALSIILPIVIRGK